MGLYELVSGILTIAGSIVLIYRIIHELESGRVKKVQLQKLCTKWLIFTIFIKIELYLLVIFDFIPLGKLLLLVLKLFLFLPKNSVPTTLHRCPTPSSKRSIANCNESSSNHTVLTSP